nr:probable LRR receptor-like serine/threonine-protein kinase At3g47570 [Aegilops tauschii subsp. strangulata]
MALYIPGSDFTRGMWCGFSRSPQILLENRADAATAPWHRNLIRILTVCVSGRGEEFKALMYGYMPNERLERWLHQDTRTLTLVQWLNIAVDVASALDYLHSDCEAPIAHCDLKPSNILLDDDMVARVDDFGLARFSVLPTRVGKLAAL